MDLNTVVAVVDPYSSGSALAREVVSRNHRCVMVQSTPEVPAIYRSSFFPEEFDSVVPYRGQLDETIKQLDEYHVGCILAGCEMGVELADQLSERMGLLSNGTTSSAARRDKGLMESTLRERGVRTPATFSSPSLTELLDWIQSTVKLPVVLKPLRGTGSENVCLCANEDDVRNAFETIKNQKNSFGGANPSVLAQEYLKGTEYAVDTVSHAGKHKIAGFWRYFKPLMYGSQFGCDSMELLQFDPTLDRTMFPYVSEILDALEVKYGPAHCELILSDDRPVVIEIGARLNGGNNPLLSRLGGGESQIDMTLDAYLNPERFLERLCQPYELPRSAMRVFLIPGKKGRLRSMPELQQFERLESFHELYFSPKPGRTVSRIVGWVLLVHEDSATIRRDREKIRELESCGFYEIESDD